VAASEHITSLIEDRGYDICLRHDISKTPQRQEEYRRKPDAGTGWCKVLTLPSLGSRFME
jgi:hypothetical protein